MEMLDYAVSPLLVIWETTRSCGLACSHCRADADPRRDPGELSTEQGLALIDQVADMGTPILILSGGDPLVREDLERLVFHAKSRGLRVGAIPAATPRLTRARLASLRDSGLDQVAFSLDASTPRAHDAFRRSPGAFIRAMTAAGWAQELGLPLQINSCFGAWNREELGPLMDLVRRLGVAFWEVFFLVPVGRGAELGGLAPEQFEVFFARLAAFSEETEMTVKLTEAQHYRRFLARLRALKPAPPPRTAAIRAGLRLPPRAVNAGDGFLFVDHLGGICPSGFLPEPRGRVQDGRLAEVYRHDALFTGLRDHARLGGKCGVCEYRELCGGSRARAKALTGDAWAADPACEYAPGSPL